MTPSLKLETSARLTTETRIPVSIDFTPYQNTQISPSNDHQKFERALTNQIEIQDAYSVLGCNTPKGSVDPDLIAKEIEIHNDHTIMVLKPIIDTIALTVTGNAAFGVKPMMSIMDATATAKDFWDEVFKSLDQYANAGDDESGLSHSKKRMPQYKRSYKLHLNDAQIRIGAQPAQSKNAPLRFEFAAHQIDDAILNDLIHWWASVDGGGIPLPALLHDARNCQRKLSFNRPAIRFADAQEPISLFQNIT